MDYKCPCQSCGQNIAFPASGRGSVQTCPHCGCSTLLYGAGPPFPSCQPAPPASAPPSPPPSQAASPTQALGVVLIGLGVLAAGYFFLSYDTSAPGTTVVNLARLSDRQNGVIIGVGAAIVGGILVGASKRS